MKILPEISPADINYDLPEGRIAKYSLHERDRSLLLIADGNGYKKRFFREAGDFLSAGSMLVLNNAKVIHARLVFHRDTGARIEVFLLEPLQPASYEQVFSSTSVSTWKCMIGNARKWKGDVLSGTFTHKGKNYILSATRISENEVMLGWEGGIAFADVIGTYGRIPLPPYIKRDAEERDTGDYQTVFSKIPGSVAAPTAGLHFTPAMMKDMRKKGYSFEELTLHVGAGTFLPVQTDRIADHTMHSERIIISKRFLQNIRNHSAEIAAVGTTSVRTMESLAAVATQVRSKRSAEPSHLVVSQWETYDHSFSDRKEVCEILLAYLDKTGQDELYAETSLMIVPGFRFLFTDTLITNFHQPGSTLLLLVSAFMGKEWKTMYQYALDNDFRFLSYGDACLIMKYPVTESGRQSLSARQ